MRRVWLLLAFCAVMIGASATIYLIGIFHTRTEVEVVRTWRKIRPGQSISEVIAILGEPIYQYAANQDYSTYGYEISEAYKQQHQLYVFMIDGFGPYLLLVFADTNGIVTFVACDPT